MNQNDYWQAGLKVFPLYGANQDGKCECGNKFCKAAFKHPKNSNWQHTPHWDEDQLELMDEMGQFKTGFGVLCDGLLVIDIDPRNGGRITDFLDYQAKSGFVVKTGGGGWHIYFKLPKAQALMSHLPQYKGVDFKSSGFVVGAGSLHSSGVEYEVEKGRPEEINEAPQELVDLLLKKDKHRATIDGASVDVTDKEIEEMLIYIDPDCDYDDWVKIGMAIHHSTEGEGLALWDSWSSKGSKYDGRLDHHWHSFGKSANPVTLGTLTHYAVEGGYKQKVTFEAEVPESIAGDDLILGTEWVDLKRPPDFVGQLTEWINSQSIRPRENLAVATALSVVSALGGVRAKDELYGMQPNLFMFCVADSSTGKDAMTQAQNDLMSAVGLARCTYGAIKSEQEVIRNLLEHQLALYNIDEIGGIMHKIENAKKRGTTPYLESVYDILMNAFTKTRGTLGIGGDLKRNTAKMIQAEIAGCQKIIDNNEDKNGFYERKLESLCQSLIDIEDGIKNPYICINGFTVPSKFDALVNHDSVTSGFFARALIVNEKEETPKKKSRTYKKPELSDQMKMALCQLAWGGRTPTERGLRVQFERNATVKTDPKAVELLERIDDYFDDVLTEDLKIIGLHSLALRGFELVIKVSMILAIPSGLRTVEHVNWAFAFVIRDIKAKSNLAAANIAKDEKRHDEAIYRSIMGMLDIETPKTTGVILNRMRRYKKDDVEKALKALELGGNIRCVESKNKTGPKSKQWFLAG